MQLTIRHTTEYAYDEAVTYALQKVRLRPLSTALQDVTNWDMLVDGGRVEASYADHYGNHVDLVSADVDTRKMTLTAMGQVETRDAAGILGRVYGRAPLWHFQHATHQTKAGANIKALAETIDGQNTRLDGLHALSAAILDTVPYETGKTDATTLAEEAVIAGKGVCQDHANIFVSAARLSGLSARYVSGYLMMNDRIDQDASHAWAEVHLENLGWVGFDVSNGVSPDERYVRLAIGRDAREAAPISGLRRGTGIETMIVSLQVQQ